MRVVVEEGGCRPCPVAGYEISGVDPSGPATRELVTSNITLHYIT